MKKLWQKIRDDKLLYSGVFCYFDGLKKNPGGPVEEDKDKKDNDEAEKGVEKGTEKSEKPSEGIKLKKKVSDEIEKTKTKIETTKTEIEKLKEKITNLEGEVKKQDGIIAESKTKIVDLNNQKQRLETSISNEKDDDKKANFQTQLNTIKNSISSFKKKQQAAITEKEKLNKELTEAKEELKKKNKELEAANKELEALEKEPVGPLGLNWPRKNPEKILTTEEYYAELGKCKTVEERRRLILDQFFAGAAKPEATQLDLGEINGKKISFQLTGPIKFGTATVRPDPITAQIMADAVGGSLPTAALFEKLYADDRIEKVPMWYGKDLLARANKLRVEAGLPPVKEFETLQLDPKTGKMKMAPRGSLMKSAEWDRAQTEMQMEWMAARGKTPKLYLGSGKTVLMQSRQGMMTFGGGLLAIRQRDKETGEMVWGMKNSLTQNMGDVAHSDLYSDYVQDSFIMSQPIIDGKVVTTEEILNNPKHADIKAQIIKYFGSPNNHYPIPDWAKAEVAKYKETGASETFTPSKLPAAPERKPIIVARAPAAPAPSYSGGVGHHGGGGMSYASAPSGAPSSGEYKNAVYMPQEDEAPKPEAPKEGSDNKEYTYTINSTLFLGDEGSLNAEVGPGVIGSKRMSEKGETTISLMKKLEAFQETFMGKGYTNSIIQIGMNDLMKEGKEFEVDAILKRLEKIWQTLASKGVKVYACTIPSFGAEGEVEENRKKLNKKILASEIPYKVVNLDSVGDISKISVEELSELIGKQYLSSLEKGSRFSLKEKSEMYAPSQTPFTTIGDSFTVGVDKHLKAGKFIQLDHHRRKIEGTKNPEMVGKGTSYMLGVLEREIIPKLEGKKGPPTVVIQGGGNDILGPLGSDKKMAQVEDKVKTNLAKMYKLSLDAGLMVVAITMPPWGQWIKTKYKGNQSEIDRHYKLWRNINEFIIAEVHKWNRQPDDKHKRIMCARADETIGTRLGNTKPEYFSKQDLLHPNSKGCKAVANQIFASINEMKRGVGFKNWLPEGAVAKKGHQHSNKPAAQKYENEPASGGGETRLESTVDMGGADPNIVNKKKLSARDRENAGKWWSKAKNLGFVSIASLGIKNLPGKLVLDSQALLRKLRAQAKRGENPQWGPNKIVVYKGTRYLFQVTWHSPHKHLTTEHMGVEVWIDKNAKNPRKKKDRAIEL